MTTPIPTQYKKMFENVEHPHSNYAPKEWREISEGEFAQSSFFTYSPIGEKYAQLWYDYNGKPLPEPGLGVRIYYMHDGTGFGLAKNYWEQRVRFFRFGCEHTYREYGLEEALQNHWPYENWRCYHNTVCSKCGHLLAYDSSD